VTRALLAALAVLLFASTAEAKPIANHCVQLGSKRFFLKPTRLGVYLLYDGKVLNADLTRAAAPGPASEWSIKARGSGRFLVRSIASRRYLRVRGRKLVKLRSARGCKRYPEAALGAKGKPGRGKSGFADAHMHLTAALRAGGLVFGGENFNRYGAPQALGNDAKVHGDDGSLDFTGNLLRSGEPAGTHDTHGWPSFKGWPKFDTYTHQQIYYRWLERVWKAGMRVVVAQTVEDESLCNIEPRKSHSCNETETIEAEVAQLRALQNYVDAQSGGRGRGWFRLVYGPKAARKVVARGKLAVLVGVESSNPFGCSERGGQPNCNRADIDRGIARMRKIGVRTMFLAHWTDNALAGAALEGGDKGQFIAALQVAQTGTPFSTGPCPHPEQGEEVQPAAPLPGVPRPVSGAAPVTAAQVIGGGRQCNTRGLTDLGDYAVRRMMDAHMLIEVDHMSEWAREQVLAIAEERGYPLVSSHTGTGGLWTRDELKRLYAQGGFATATIDDAAKMPAKLLGFKHPGVGLGTDTGGFNALPAPDPAAERKPLRYPFRSFDRRVRFTRQRTGQRRFDLNRDGVAHYGLLPDLLADLQRRAGGRAALRRLFRSAEAYLRTWTRVSRAR
jgi:microsomal dipeptidase-like Zn-dependent dipeptidase